jgi:hypothetical protein
MAGLQTDSVPETNVGFLAKNSMHETLIAGSSSRILWDFPNYKARLRRSEMHPEQQSFVSCKPESLQLWVFAALGTLIPKMVVPFCCSENHLDL